MSQQGGDFIMFKHYGFYVQMNNGMSFYTSQLALIYTDMNEEVGQPVYFVNKNTVSTIPEGEIPQIVGKLIDKNTIELFSNKEMG